MSFPENMFVEIPNDGAAPPMALLAIGDEVNVNQMSDKGYDYVRDPGAGFTAVLEGSVSRRNWSTIVALAASAQGAVPAQYNFVRVNVTVGGALGATTELMVGGKVI